MALELGREPTQLKLFRRLNYKESKEPSQPTRRILQKAADVYAVYEILKETSQTEGSSVDDFTIFLIAVGGKNKRGHAYGFGFEASLLGGASTSTQSTGCTPNEFHMMQHRVNGLTEEL